MKAEAGATHAPELTRTAKCRQIYLPTLTLGIALMSFSLGYSWMVNVMAQVYADLSCLRLFNLSYHECKNQSTPSQIQRWDNVTVDSNNESAVIGLSLAVLQAIMCPVVCTFADSVGRKATLLFCGTLSTSLFLAVALLPHDYIYTYAAYFAGLSGFSGGIYCFLAITFAAVADISAPLTPKERTVLFGMVESGCWLGMSGGPLVSAAVVDWLAPQKEIAGVQTSFFFSVGFILFAVLLVAVSLRETLQERKKVTWASINPFAGLRHIKSRSVGCITASNVIVLISTATGTAMMPLYMLTYFASDSEFADQSYVMCIYFASSGIGLLVLLPVAARFLSQRVILLLSGALTTVTWCLFGAPRSVWVLYVVAALMAGNGFEAPVVRTFLTRHFGPEHYGNALGLLGFLHSVSSVLAPAIKVGVWDLELYSGVQGMVFYVIGGLGLFGLVCAVVVKFPRDELVPGAATPRPSTLGTDDAGDNDSDHSGGCGRDAEGAKVLVDVAQLNDGGGSGDHRRSEPLLRDWKDEGGAA